MERLVVVGGGISGLATAFRARQEAERRGRALSVTVLEADARPGGKMWTDRTGGYAIEWGPNGFLDSKPDSLDLARDIGARDLLLPASGSAKKRFVCRGGRLLRLPETPGAFLRSPPLSCAGKLRLLGEPFAPPPPEQGEETVAAFAERRLGPEARDYLIDPMVSGIHAGDPSRLSVDAAFPRVKELEAQYGGLFRGMAGVMRERRRAGKRAEGAYAGPGGTLTSFRGGVLTLIDLARTLRSSLVLNARATSLRRTATGWLVGVDVDGQDRTWPADAVVLACPPWDAARLVAGNSSSAAAAMEAIPSASIAVVATSFARPDVPGDVDGFGFLVPHVEGRSILGTLWDSSVFTDRAPAGQVLLRSMVGGFRAPDRARRPDAALVADVRRELADLMGIRADPTLVRVYRHDRGIPQYTLGHRARVAAIDAGLATLPGVWACHNGYRGIALNDCAREARSTAARMAAFLFG